MENHNIQNIRQEELDMIEEISKIKKEDTRFESIKNVCKYENNENLAIYLLYSPGIMASILQELVIIYQNLSNKKSLDLAVYIVKIFKIILENPITRKDFIDSQILVFLYPLLNRTKNNCKLQISVLSLIFHSIKKNDSKFIEFLVKSKLIPILCRTKKGNEFSIYMTCLIFIAILAEESLIKYIFDVEERLSAILVYISHLLHYNLSERVEDCVIKLFYQLSITEEAKILIRKVIPEKYYKESFRAKLDENTRNILIQLLNSLGEEKLENESMIDNIKTNCNKNKIPNINIINNNSGINELKNSQINYDRIKLIQNRNINMMSFYNNDKNINQIHNGRRLNSMEYNLYNNEQMKMDEFNKNHNDNFNKEISDYNDNHQ